MQGDPQGVADALSLRRSGSEYKGPCPLCGGVDRFHVRAGRSADLLVHCRHGCKYSDLARELERRGIIDSDDYSAPQHRRADLEHCDHMIAVMRGAAARGETIGASDAIAIGRLITLVDEGRQKQLKELREQMGQRDGSREGKGRQSSGEGTI